jgi:hypothetical protein
MKMKKMNPKKASSYIYFIVQTNTKVCFHMLISIDKAQSMGRGEGVDKCTQESTVQLYKHLSPTSMPK